MPGEVWVYLSALSDHFLSFPTWSCRAFDTVHSTPIETILSLINVLPTIGYNFAHTRSMYSARWASISSHSQILFTVQSASIFDCTINAIPLQIKASDFACNVIVMVIPMTELSAAAAILSTLPGVHGVVHSSKHHDRQTAQENKQIHDSNAP